jgi:ATP-dependent Zn protease
MGQNVIYSDNSDKYKEKIDNEIIELINKAYEMSQIIVKNTKDLILECSKILIEDKILKIDKLEEIVKQKYPEIFINFLDNKYQT